MTTTNHSRLLATVAIALFAAGVFTFTDGHARDLQGRSFSRQGPAATGSLSGERRATASSTRSANQGQRQDFRSQGRDTRQEGYTERTDIRQQGYTERADIRQEGYSERADIRRDYADDRHDYYDDHDDDDWDAGSAAVGFVAGAVVGAVVTDAVKDSSTPTTTTVVTTAPPAPVGGLPCAPEITSVKGVTYFRCGQSYYTQAYGPSGPVYMPVQPPN
jgi:Meckel syndrome type 1 protein